MLLAETSIEVLGHLLGVDGESTVNSRLHIDNSCPLSRVKLQVLHLREKEVCLFRRFVLDAHKVSFIHILHRNHPLMMSGLVAKHIDGDIVLSLFAKLRINFTNK